MKRKVFMALWCFLLCACSNSDTTRRGGRAEGAKSNQVKSNGQSSKAENSMAGPTASPASHTNQTPAPVPVPASAPSRFDADIKSPREIQPTKKETGRVDGFNIPIHSLKADKGDWVWAAAAKPKQPRKFIFRRSRIKAVRRNSAVVGVFGEVAPAAFIYPSNSNTHIAIGQTVLAQSGATSLYARVIAKDGQQYILATGRAKPRQVKKTAAELRLIEPAAWQAGGVVIFRKGRIERSATIVHVDGETIFFTTYSGGLDQRKRADLTLVDMSRRFQVGDSVYGEPSGGLSMHYQKGRVVSVDKNHTRYEVKTKDGKMFVSNFKTIVAAP
ncbi:MAG: hypothetical protein VYA30_14605 [Myxococcota bacterium]|nr:hypothetical protein [Myxococcota bacterium]